MRRREPAPYFPTTGRFLDNRYIELDPAGFNPLAYGCWRAQYGVQHVSHAVAALGRAGYVTKTIEYRRVGDEGGGWPGTFDEAQ